MPTQEQVQTEIEKLKEMEPRIRHHSAFGDDNRAQVRAQIRVLEEELSTDAIYDLDGLVSDEAIEGMLYARQWLDGDEPEPPSEDWEGLVEE